jgi:hypothetical protein
MSVSVVKERSEFLRAVNPSQFCEQNEQEGKVSFFLLWARFLCQRLKNTCCSYQDGWH